MKHRLSATVLVSLLRVPGAIVAQDHSHDHGATGASVKPPKIFLDKSPRIVEYQLGRLSNERLLLVERNTGDPKYAPVYAAILRRAGMPRQQREEALGALVKLSRSSAVAELLKALVALDPEGRVEPRTGADLAELLLRRPSAELKDHVDALRGATASDSPLVRSVGYAGLIASGGSGVAWEEARREESATLDWIAAVRLLPDPELRSSLRGTLAGLIEDSQLEEIRRAAIRAIASVPSRRRETFGLVAPLVADPRLRAAAVSTLLAIPGKERDPEVSRRLADFLVKLAEETPAEERTTDDFTDAMQLAHQLLAGIPLEEARSYRERLRSVTVRVVRIRTVEEEMRYDTPWFAVEAGRPVQVILQNEDLMPHNLVITLPGALREVAELGLAAGPAGHDGKQYVPDSEKVLHATHMVQPGRREALHFTAPSEPGEYPYVCTFPRHWVRMYGVMVVARDLDAWLQDPTEPEDPIGSDRSFVSAWSMEDFPDDLDSSFRGRTMEIGQRLFAEATCSQCHAVRGEGGAVGPDLTDVFERWKGDRRAVLREVLDPSYRLEPKYAVHVVVTRDGRVATGIVTAEDRSSISLVENPEVPTPAVIQRGDVAEMVKTSKSMMPRALLDRFTKDEIFEILAFLEASGENRSSR